MKLIICSVLALASTLSVSCLQCYNCRSPITDLLPAGNCLNSTATCEGGNTTCISISQDHSNQTLITKGCAPAGTCDNLQAKYPSTCVQCGNDFCNNGTLVPGNETITTTTMPAVITTTTPKGSNGTTTTVKPVVTITTPKAQPTKKKNSASSVGSSLAVLVLAVVLQYKLN